MLRADCVVKRYGKVTALDNFTLHVEAGEIAGLVGHNGAGKTTFVEIVSGLLQADSGRVSIGGRSPRAARQNIGVAPQLWALYPSATVREHLRLYGGLYGLRRGALKAAIDEVADVVRLHEFIDRQVGVLSGGQQRRTQAASALLNRPGLKLLMLDEPTVGADAETRQALLAVVRKRAADGVAVLYTTHYLPELSELDATIAVARSGRVIARGTSDRLLAGLPSELRVRLDDEEVRVSTTDPTGGLMTMLTDLRAVPREIEIRKPSLDDLLASLAVADVA